MVVAAAQAAGVENLASADADFEQVKELKVYRPSDLG